MDKIDAVVQAEGAEMWINHELGTEPEYSLCSELYLAKRIRSLITGLKLSPQLMSYDEFVVA